LTSRLRAVAWLEKAALLVAFLLVFTTLGIAVSAPAPAGPQSGGSPGVSPPWAMYGRDPTHSGWGPVNAPSSLPDPAWTPFDLNVAASDNASPVVGPDGTIYVPSDKGFFAVNPNGTQKWKRWGTDPFDNTNTKMAPAVAVDGTVYVVKDSSTDEEFWPDDAIYALDPADGSTLWHYVIGRGTYGSPMIGPDGTIYIGSAKSGVNSSVFAINPNGSEKWTWDSGSTCWIESSPALGPNGEVYVVHNCLGLIALDSNGDPLWDRPGLGDAWNSPSVGPDGTVYVADSSTLYALDPIDGSTIWDEPTSSPMYLASAAISSDGSTIYRGDNGGMFYAFRSTGSLKWQFDTGICSPIYAAPALSENGVAYFTQASSTCVEPEDKGHVYALRAADGQLLWKREIGFSSHSPALGSDGTLYALANGASGDELHAFGCGPDDNGDGVGDDCEPAVIPPDFNGDGYADQAIGVEGEDVGSSGDAGAVNVIYGSATGLAAAGNQIWTQNSPGILDTAEGSDNFGDALAWGDFNADGYSDLAVGVYGETFGSVVSPGQVNVIYGSATGLAAAGNQIWNQNSPGILGTAEDFDFFGWSLAGGDFNGDRYSDLAVGVFGEDVGSIDGAGEVSVIYGSATGLAAAGNQIWNQNSPGILDAAEAGDGFGSSLAGADFNADGYSDLVVGVIGESVGSISGAGQVNVIYGSATGLAAAGNQIWNQNSPGILETAEESDSFGVSLAGGDFNGDGYSDLAVGVPFESIGFTVFFSGLVNVIYGSATGLAAAGNQIWNQNSPGILDTAEGFDYFGDSLAGGDFNGDGYSDLAIAVPGESVGSIDDAGQINVIYGSASGLAAGGNQIWNQNSPGILDTAEAGDLFGSSLAGGDVNADGYSDLGVGVNSESVGSIDGAGQVNVLRGSATGLAAAGNQIWNQNSPGILDTAEEFDYFGSSL